MYPVFNKILTNLIPYTYSNSISQISHFLQLPVTYSTLHHFPKRITNFPLLRIGTAGDSRANFPRERKIERENFSEGIILSTKELLCGAESNTFQCLPLTG